MKSIMTIAAVFTARGVTAEGEATVRPFTGNGAAERPSGRSGKSGKS